LLRSVRRSEWLVLGKYLLFQLPSWGVIGALAYGARSWLGFPDWTPWAVLGALMLKDAVLFPYVRHAYAVEAREAAHHLLGARGVVERISDHDTWVRVGAELWRAGSGAEGLTPGAAVRVAGIDGLVLRVRPEAEDDPR
jgi:membrane protein implicated in regulation of membrane protease activity